MCARVCLYCDNCGMNAQGQASEARGRSPFTTLLEALRRWASMKTSGRHVRRVIWPGLALVSFRGGAIFQKRSVHEPFNDVRTRVRSSPQLPQRTFPPVRHPCAAASAMRQCERKEREPPRLGPVLTACKDGLIQTIPQIQLLRTTRQNP